MVNSLKFSKRLQKILDYYGLSATAFSERIHFNRSTISHLLSARNKPSLEFVMKVLETFPEVELYWLLNGVGNFPSSSSNNLNQRPKKVVSSSEENHSSEEIINTGLFQATETKQEIYNPVNKEVPPLTEAIPATKTIERIVIFFKDGSFKSYQ